MNKNEGCKSIKWPFLIPFNTEFQFGGVDAGIYIPAKIRLAVYYITSSFIPGE
jgi:hypothetical protein